MVMQRYPLRWKRTGTETSTSTYKKREALCGL